MIIGHVSTILVSVLVSVVWGEVEVNVDIYPSHTMPQENVTLVCRLSGTKDEMTVFWYKEVRDQQGIAVKELIATNDIVSPLYKSLGRFSSKVTPAGSATLYVLNLILVSSEDSGHYGCYLSGDMDTYDSVPLTVYKPPDEISFTNRSNSVILLSEGRPVSVECRVQGVVPTPTLSLWLGETDYTYQFTQQVHTQVLCSGSYGTKENCPLHYLYTVYLRHPQFVPSMPVQDQQTLRCEATLPDSGYDPVVAELDIVYQFSPKFECDRVHYTVRGTENYALSCQVTYSPAFDWWSWTFDVDGLTYELRSDRDPGYTHTEVKVEQEILSETSMILSLTISEVQPEFYTVYRLQVSNAQGNNSVNLQLREIAGTTPVIISNYAMSSHSVHLFVTMGSLPLVLLLQQLL